MQLQLNLASRAYVNRRGLYGSYALLGGVLIVLLAFNVSYLLRLRAHGSTLKIQLKELEGKSESRGDVDQEVNPADLEKRRQEVAFANGILIRDSFRWTALLDKLEDVAVDGVGIRSLQPNFKENSLGLTAVARGVSEMQEYLDQLMTSPAFSEVYLLRQSSNKGTGDNVRQEISFSVDLKGVF